MEYSKSPELEFLRYAFPCTYMRKIRGKITDKDIDTLKSSLILEKPLSKEYLEKSFEDASKELDKIASELKKDKWSLDVIYEYFLVRHNSIVDADENLPVDSLKDMCRILEGNVISCNGDYVTVNYSSNQKPKTRNVSKEFFKDIKLGDKVRFHYGYVVDKL